MTIEAKADMIRRYIIERKGVDIGAILEPRNEREWDLFNRAFAVAFEWFINKADA